MIYEHAEAPIDKLKKDGGVGYIDEMETIHSIDPKFLPMIGTTTKELLNVSLTEGMYQAEGTIGLVEGKTYTVTTDSGTFEGVCKVETADSDDPTIYYIGNMAVIFGDEADDTGESYFVAEADGVVMAVDGNENGTKLVISDKKPAINPEYLAGVPVFVNITTSLTSTETALTDEENAALNLAVERGHTHIFADFPVSSGGYKLPVLLSYNYISGMDFYVGFSGYALGKIILRRTEGVWYGLTNMT